MNHITPPLLSAETMLFHSPMGDEVHFAREAMIVCFAGRRGVVSSSNLHGGYRSDLRYAFNHSVGRDPDILQKRHPKLKGTNIVEHYAAIASELGLDPDRTTGMGTAALIENHVRASRSEHGVRVEAVATAGIDVNGGRAGDPASWDEFTHCSLLPPPGTINIFLFIDARLTPGGLTRALITATEAKTAALQELMAPSRYSEGLATGSGTDSLIAVCNEDSPTLLYDAGKHVLLGQMIGQAVKEAVTGALAKQSGMNAQRQRSFLQQGTRYGLDAAHLLPLWQHNYPTSRHSLEQAAAALEQLGQDERLSAQLALILHLLDQWRWGLVSWQTLCELASLGRTYIARRYRLSPHSDSLAGAAQPSSELLLVPIRQLLVELLDKKLEQN